MACTQAPEGPWGRGEASKGEVRSGGVGGVAGPTDRQTERRSGTHVPGTRNTAAGDEREHTETRGPLSPVAGAVPRAPGTPAT